MESPLPTDNPRSELPLELTDGIIDLIATHQDGVVTDLAACALVCRAWMARSRLHLFRDFHLVVLTKSNLPKFAALVRSQHCTIVPHVQALALHKNGGRVNEYDMISDVLERLTAVKRLRLTGPYWDAHGAPPRRGFMKSLPHVVDLEVDHASLGDFHHALQIFCAFPALEQLSIRDTNIDHESGWGVNPHVPYAPPSYLLPEYVTPPAQLTSLAISYSTAVIHLCGWLNWAATCRLTRLELRLGTLKTVDLPPLRQFLQSQRTCLEEVTFIHLLSAVDRELIHDICALTHLRHLHIGPFYLVPASNSWLQNELPSVLRTVKSPAFKRLTLEVHDGALESISDYSRCTWPLLDGFLAEKVQIQPSFEVCFFAPVPFSRKPHIAVPTVHREPRATTVITNGFPRLHACGGIVLRLDGLRTSVHGR
ncbi:hypothetical protein C8R46DRAFT_1358664 [Mycena filopes]|nr:hypothetical protein C8R46DRAFT_1358664 [Mycena filopes]